MILVSAFYLSHLSFHPFQSFVSHNHLIARKTSFFLSLFFKMLVTSKSRLWYQYRIERTWRREEEEGTDSSQNKLHGEEILKEERRGEIPCSRCCQRTESKRTTKKKRTEIVQKAFSSFLNRLASKRGKGWDRSKNRKRFFAGKHCNPTASLLTDSLALHPLSVILPQSSSLSHPLRPRSSKGKAVAQLFSGLQFYS